LTPAFFTLTSGRVLAWLRAIFLFAFFACRCFRGVAASNQGTDDFAAAPELFGSSIVLEGDNEHATQESGEPSLSAFGDTIGKTIWWTWTAPFSGTVLLVAEPSSFCPIAGVYVGSSIRDLTSLTTCACHSAPGQFFAISNTTYRICADAWAFPPRPTGGRIRLQLQSFPRPDNDQFAGRLVLTGMHATASGDNRSATNEVDEPNTGVLNPTYSLWWTWRAPVDADVRLTIEGLQYPAMGVYRGKTLEALSAVPLERNNNGHDNLFHAVEGGDYVISLDSSAPGSFFLNLDVVRLAFVAPAENSKFTAPPFIDLQAKVIGSDLPITLVRFFSDGNLLDTRTSPPFSLVWTNPPIGQHLLTLEGIDVFGRTNTSLPVAIRVEPPPIVRPANNDFAGRILLPGPYYQATVTNDLATVEPGEPETPFGKWRSLWWSWRAPADCEVTLRASGAPIVSVYVGESVESISRIAIGFNGLATGTQVRFTATSNTVYQISLDSEIATSINFELTANVSNDLVPNNNFASSIDLGSGPSVTMVGDNTQASKEAGEPDHAGNSGGKSLWWTWTAPTSGRVHLSSIQSSFTPLLSVYQGEVLSTLAVIGRNELLPYIVGGCGLYVEVCGPPDCPYTTDVFFQAQAGATYHIAVDGMSAYGRLVSGPLRVSLDLSTLRFVDPLPGRRTFGPTDIALMIDFDRSVHPMLQRLDILAGTNWIARAIAPDFRAVWSNAPPGRYDLKATALIENGAVIESAVQPLFIGSSTNDDIASAIFLAGNSASLVGNNVGATLEDQEPLLPGSSLGRTLWWSWTAPASGKVSLTADPNSEFVLPVGIYSGTELTNLFLIASNSFLQCVSTGFRCQDCFVRQRDRLVFPVERNATYLIAVDGFRFGDCNGSSTDVAGPFSFDLLFSSLPNDHFDARTVLSGQAISLTNSTFGATVDPGEPVIGTNILDHSVWYRWKAPFSGRVRLTSHEPFTNSLSGLSASSGTISFPGWPAVCTVLSEIPASIPFVPIYSVFEGESLNSLAPVGSGEWVTFDATEGHEYQVSVSGRADSSGEFPLLLTEMRPPENDAFSTRTRLVGTSVMVEGNNLAATSEPAEPPHSSDPSRFRSVWYTWTAPLSGPVVVSAFSRTPPATQLRYANLPIRIYKGSSLRTLTGVTALTVGENLALAAEAGVSYQIAVVEPDAGSDYTGFFRLTIYGLDPPWLDPANSRYVGKDFDLAVVGQVGQPFTLEVSDDLRSWDRLVSAQLSGPAFHFLDQNAAAFDRRFYRITLLYGE
jgi:hypothetical protein